MRSLDTIAVEARRSGIKSTTVAKQMYEAYPDATVEEVVHAFAIAGYPAIDNSTGTYEYLFSRGSITNAMEERIYQKMRDVGYPENEVKEAEELPKG